MDYFIRIGIIYYIFIYLLFIYYIIVEGSEGQRFEMAKRLLNSSPVERSDANGDKAEPDESMTR